MGSDTDLQYVIHRCSFVEMSLYFLWRRYSLRITSKVCLNCIIDIFKDEGYLEEKHWNFCPYCGAPLVAILGYPDYSHIEGL